MKNSILLPLFLLLISCSPPTKEEALDYFIKIRYEILDETYTRIGLHSEDINSYMGNPAKLVEGPTDEEYEYLIYEQNAIISLIKECIELMDEVEQLGDKSMYYDKNKSYLKKKLKFEEGTMLTFVLSLKGGAEPGENDFSDEKYNELVEVKKSTEAMLESEENFLKEFNISYSDIEEGLIKRGY
jgi:hypothetical protein